MSRDPLNLDLDGYDLRWSTETDGLVLSEPAVNPWCLADLLERSSVRSDALNALYHRTGWLTQNGLVVDADAPPDSVTGAEAVRKLVLAEGIAVDTALVFALPPLPRAQAEGPLSFSAVQKSVEISIRRARRFAKLETPVDVVEQCRSQIQDLVAVACTHSVVVEVQHLVGHSVRHETHTSRTSRALEPTSVTDWANRARATREVVQDAARRLRNDHHREHLGHILQALGLRGTPHSVDPLPYT